MTTQFLTETVTTPVNYNCDVLVCGGGTAGVTAASPQPAMARKRCLLNMAAMLAVR